MRRLPTNPKSPWDYTLRSFLSDLALPREIFVAIPAEDLVELIRYNYALSESFVVAVLKRLHRNHWIWLCEDGYSVRSREWL